MSFYVCVWAFFKLSQHFFSSYFSSSSKPLSSLVLRLLGGKRSSEQLCTNKLADESGFKMLHNGGRHYLGSDGAIPDRQAHLLSATGTLTENKLGHILSLFLLNCSLMLTIQSARGQNQTCELNSDFNGEPWSAEVWCLSPQWNPWMSHFERHLY